MAAVLVCVTAFVLIPDRAPLLAPHSHRAPIPLCASSLHDVAKASTRPRPLPTAAAAAASSDVVRGRRSVLVLGWFHATPRELEYVKRQYLRNGYDDVVLEPSVPQIIAQPRGWYRSMRRRLQPKRHWSNPAAPGGGHALGRRFDTVHCLSGGFLSLYVLLRSGVPLTFTTLLLDSTPILPKPAAITQFARSYMAAAGLTLPLRLLSFRAHQFLVRARWAVGLYYVKLRHQLLTALGRLQGAALDNWTGGPISWALANQYGRVADHALGTIYERASGQGGNVIFMYNPDDPFISTSDVNHAACLARAVGLPVREVLVDVDHVKGLFQRDAAKRIFEILRFPTLHPSAPPSAPPLTNRRMIEHLVEHGYGGAAAPLASTT